ncbi:SAV_6107 family HEPN domain-containing protein [Corynebacterium mayonis]|uniref:SAV_6107 family HEPN domain-containing protein n=1 Tax=Corynebacterium mayonis TaxID=3062461 RepID=UPI00313FF3E1
MNSVISATTGVAYGAAGTPKSARFFQAADDLLRGAHKQLQNGDLELALEYGYRAALRIAGAICADSPTVMRRKRLPTSAWDKLALSGEREATWAKEFSAYSALRSRVASGVAAAPSEAAVRRFVARVETFRDSFLPGALLVA